MTCTSRWRALTSVMASARSPSRTVDPLHDSGSVSERLATYFGTPLRRSVNGISFGAFGQ